MSELINTFDIKNPTKAIAEDREGFYLDQVRIAENGGKPTMAVEVIAVLLFNERGELLIQKRSFEKGHNPGLLDKSIGGHVKSGDPTDYTVMVETIQELQTPSIVLKNEEDFLKTFTLLREYLDTVAVMQHINTELHELPRVIREKEIKVFNLVPLYFGVYNGRIRPVDREAKGVLWYSLAELEREMKKLPEAFTFDLHYYVGKYGNEIRKFVDTIAKK